MADTQSQESQESREATERQAQETRNRLQALELASGLLFQSRRDEAIRRTAGLSPASQADQIGKAISAATIDSRQLARAGGINRLVVEADALGVNLAPEKLPLETARDFTRARMVGQSYSERWYRNVVNATPAEAKAATQGSLDRIAVTENSEAFSSGRSKYLQSKPNLGLLRVWDATLDKLTCPICGAADGTIVGAHEPFPYGEPGSVHPYDRCCWTLLRSTETGGETLIEPRVATTQVQVPGAASSFAPKGLVPSGGKLAVSAETKALARRLDVALGNVAKDGGAAARAEVRALLGQHGIKARSLGKGANAIKVTDPADMGGMAGFHEWDGTIRLAPNTVRDSRAALRKIQLGIDPGDDHANALNVFLHEEIHGASAMTKSAYQGAGAALEEAATELAARRVSRQLMGREIGANYADEIAGLRQALGKVSKAKVNKLDDAILALKSNAPLAKTPAQHIDNFVDALKLTPNQRTKLTKALNETEWWKPGATATKKPVAKAKAVKAAKPKTAAKPRAPPKPKAVKKPKVDAGAAKAEKTRLAAEQKAAKAAAAAEAKAKKAADALAAKEAKAKAIAEAKAARVKATKLAKAKAEPLPKAPKEPKAAGKKPIKGPQPLSNRYKEVSAAFEKGQYGKVRGFIRDHIDHTFPGAVSKDATWSTRVRNAKAYRVVPSLGGADGAHYWNGSIQLTEAAHTKLGETLKALAAGERPSDTHALSLLIHEEIHGYSRIASSTYQGHGALLEEVGTELSARHALRSLGFKTQFASYDLEIMQAESALQKAIPGLSDEDARSMLVRAHHKAMMSDGYEVREHEHAKIFASGLDATEEQRNVFIDALSGAKMIRL